jgi:hypothetical protein
MAFDTRRAVEEKYPDRFAPMSEQDRADFDAVNNSITLFAILVVVVGFLGLAMIVIGTIEHAAR